MAKHNKIWLALYIFWLLGGGATAAAWTNQLLLGWGIIIAAAIIMLPVSRQLAK